MVRAACFRFRSCEQRQSRTMAEARWTIQSISVEISRTASAGSRCRKLRANMPRDKQNKIRMQMFSTRVRKVCVMEILPFITAVCCVSDILRWS